MTVRVSIVLAVQYAAANVPRFLERVHLEEHPDLEVLVCSADPLPELGQHARLRVLRAPSGTLIPELWAAGILAARGERVATTTAHCLPDTNWVGQLLAGGTDAAAVGGCIAPAPDEKPHARAIYLMRYLPFAPPGRSGNVDEVPADNALYLRAAVLEHRDLLAEGFWEPSFHARFRRDGLQLTGDPALIVQHANLYSPMTFARQRLAHGGAFGRARIAGAPWGKRALFTLASPLLAVLFLSRLLVRALRSRSGGLVRALPFLLLYVGFWSAGEARAYWQSIVSPR